MVDREGICFRPMATRYGLVGVGFRLGVGRGQRGEGR